MEQDERYMRHALMLAERAAALGEIPVGAVIVRAGAILGEGYNRRETDRTALGHAEILAIQDACRRTGGWRLDGSTIYITLEPCPMCAGAILSARIARVVYGARDPKTGSAGSIADLFAMPYPHRPDLTSGLLAPECQALLDRFFAHLRGRNGDGASRFYKN